MDPNEFEDDDIDTVETQGLEDPDEPEDDDEGVEDESEDDESDESDAADDVSEPEKAEKPKGKRTAEERIAELARLRREAEKTAFEAELRTLELERRLAALESGKAADAPKKPDPKDFKYGEVDEDYLSAVVDYRVEMRSAEARSAASKAAEAAEAQRLNDHYEKLVLKGMQEGRAKFKDFDEVVNSVAFEPQLARMILDSDTAVDIAYHLGNNIGELRSLTRMSPAERARHLGRLEAKFSAASAAKKRRTSAPPPLGSSKTATAKHETLYGPGGSQDAFDDAFFGRSK